MATVLYKYCKIYLNTRRLRDQTLSREQQLFQCNHDEKNDELFVL